MNSFSIDFGREYKIYLSGEVLEGEVVLPCRKSTEIAELSMRLLGETKTGWFDSNSKSQFKSHELHLQIDRDLTANLRCLQEENESLSAKIYKIPFKFELPKDLPSSVKCDLGWTRYACVLIVDRKEVVEVEFTLIAHIPLDYIRSLEQLGSKSRHCIQRAFGAKDEVIVQLELPKEDYMMGEIITPSILLEFTGNRIFNCVGVGLLQELAVASKEKLHSKVQRATVSRLLVEITFGPMPHPALVKFDGSLRIPSCAPPSQTGGLISVKYDVVVVGDHPSFPDNISVPILIGHANQI